MKRGALFLLAVLALQACKNKTVEEGVFVTVNADSDVAGIVQLKVTVSNAGTDDHLLLPGVPQSKPMVFPTEFSISTPSSRTGRVTIVIEGIDSSGLSTASGSTFADLVANTFVPKAVDLQRTASPCGNDGSCADASVGSAGADADSGGTVTSDPVGTPDVPVATGGEQGGAGGAISEGTLSGGGTSGAGGDTGIAGSGGTSAGGRGGGGSTTGAGPDCPSLADPASGSVSVSTRSANSTATYSCDTGYKLTGTTVRTCQTDGTWSDTEPTCALVDCQAPPTTRNSSVSAPTTTYGSTATYSCWVGSNLSDTTTRTCQADGTWSGTVPTCLPADCGPLKNPTNGSVKTPTTTYGSVATYSCDSGYAITGVATRSCQASAIWSDAAPSCSVQMLTVTINKIGAGTGTVTSTPAGISCGSTCQATFAYGTGVALSAAPDANQSFMGWDRTDCAGTGWCKFSLTSNTVVRASFSPPPNIVFTTSTTQTAALGGLAGADALCAQRAVAAGLAGTYRAWLSTSTVNAIDRLGSASGWVRPDGKPVLNSIGDVAQNKIFYPPRLDEFGNDLGANQAVLTATAADGTLIADTRSGASLACDDFTSAANVVGWMGGLASANCAMFTGYYSDECSEYARLYCFGTDRTAQVAVAPATGRHAFMTAGHWIPGGGIGSADTFCQNEATAANLPGTYKALLAPSGASAASRFSESGAPWISSDGIPLAATASAFFSAALLDVSPNSTADGSVRYANYVVWSGAATMTTAGTDTTTCGNWQTQSGAGSSGIAGDTSATRFFGNSSSTSCSFGFGLLTCLQE